MCCYVETARGVHDPSRGEETVQVDTNVEFSQEIEGVERALRRREILGIERTMQLRRYLVCSSSTKIPSVEFSNFRHQ